MRALRIRDENAPPQLPSGKVLHQRNKSTPALSALAQVGGLKAPAAKRAVFADVSNTVRQPVVKDDLQVSGKVVQLDVLKDPAVVAAKELPKPALLRPAQRPLSTKPNASNGSIVPPTVPKHAASDANLAATNAGKTLSKKATRVFKESHSDPLATYANTANDIAPAPAPARSALAGRSKSKQNTEHGPVVIDTLEKVSEEQSGAHIVSGDKHAQHPTRELLPKIELKEKELQVVKKVAVAAVETEPKASVLHVEVQESYEYLDALEEQARVIEQERNEELAKSQALTRLDPEEYWDEDEEEEYYDADGYTTARSLRSRGDNTTGGVTLVLAPRITAKSQRELEAARQYVEANKSQEDIEDEQWDTSMVAEYGEEIFEYMRELEVCDPSPSAPSPY
jgi:hypothetical protein